MLWRRYRTPWNTTEYQAAVRCNVSQLHNTGDHAATASRRGEDHDEQGFPPNQWLEFPPAGGKSQGGVRVRLFARLSLAAVLLATFVTLQALPLQAQTTTEVEVPYNWSLKPAGLGVGDQFRLLFLSSTKTDATATDIADYNTFIQNLAAAGHDDIQDHSAGFRVVGCTADVDARDNTGTNTNTDGAGVPVYWLNGDKVTDDNADFYDGDWDDEVNDKNESGNNGPNTSVSSQYPRTGCDHDGTEFFFNAMSNGLGMAHVMAGRPNNSTGSNGPISSGISHDKNSTRPMYGLSQVFEVASPGDATLSSLALEDGGGNTITLTPTFSPGATTYTASVGITVTSTTVTAQPTNSNATAVIKLDGVTDADGTVDLVVGLNTITVEVTSEDTTTMLTYQVTVTVAGAFGPGKVLVSKKSLSMAEGGGWQLHAGARQATDGECSSDDRRACGHGTRRDSDDSCL